MPVKPYEPTPENATRIREEILHFVDGVSKTEDALVKRSWITIRFAHKARHLGGAAAIIDELIRLEKLVTYYGPKGTSILGIPGFRPKWELEAEAKQKAKLEAKEAKKATLPTFKKLMPWEFTDLSPEEKAKYVAAETAHREAEMAEWK